MKKVKLILGFLLISSSTFGQMNGTVSVTISEIKDQGKGEVILMLFNSDDGFPVDPEKAVFKAAVIDFDESLEYTFEDVPFGTYAVAAFQDKNKNGKVDTRRLIPMPKEPVAALNVTKRGRPKYVDSTFEVSTVATTLSLIFINQ